MLHQFFATRNLMAFFYWPITARLITNAATIKAFVNNTRNRNGFMSQLINASYYPGNNTRNPILDVARLLITDPLSSHDGVLSRYSSNTLNHFLLRMWGVKHRLCAFNWRFGQFVISTPPIIHSRELWELANISFALTMGRLISKVKLYADR